MSRLFYKVYAQSQCLRVQPGPEVWWDPHCNNGGGASLKRQAKKILAREAGVEKRSENSNMAPVEFILVYLKMSPQTFRIVNRPRSRTAQV